MRSTFVKELNVLHRYATTDRLDGGTGCATGARPVGQSYRWVMQLEEHERAVPRVIVPRATHRRYGGTLQPQHNPADLEHTESRSGSYETF